MILVVHGGKSTSEVIRRTRDELSIVGARIFGVVLNNFSPVDGDSYSYETYGDYQQGTGAATGGD